MAQHSLAEQAARQKDEQRQREIDAAVAELMRIKNDTVAAAGGAATATTATTTTTAAAKPSNDENVEHRKDNAMAPLVAKNTHNADGEDGEGSTALSIIEGGSTLGRGRSARGREAAESTPRARAPSKQRLHSRPP